MQHGSKKAMIKVLRTNRLIPKQKGNVQPNSVQKKPRITPFTVPDPNVACCGIVGRDGVEGTVPISLKK